MPSTASHSPHYLLHQVGRHPARYTGHSPSTPHFRSKALENMLDSGGMYGICICDALAFGRDRDRQGEFLVGRSA